MGDGAAQSKARAARGSLVLAMLLAGSGAIAQSAGPQELRLPARLVGDLHGAFGEHHARAVHTKGMILRGTFEPDPAARALSSASVFRQPVPIVVRFSDFTGIPDIPDTDGHANPRGFAVKFLLPDGGAFDIVNHSFNGFPVASAGEFSLLLRAIAASGPAAAKPTPLDVFLATHPIAKTFLTTQQSPESWATSNYFGVNAVTFVAADGSTRHVRYRFVPAAGEHLLDDAALRARGPDYLAQELRERIGRGPIRFTWYAQVAAPGDAIENPSIAWPESRRLVRLGTLVIDRLAANTPAEDKALLFLPGDLPPGIAIADPMLSIRNAAYPVSFSERQ